VVDDNGNRWWQVVEGGGEKGLGWWFDTFDGPPSYIYTKNPRGKHVHKFINNCKDNIKLKFDKDKDK